MNVDRLNKLADFLETVPAGRFHMAKWISTDKDSAEVVRIDATCGTQACALGWATAIPEFKDAGLFGVVSDGWSAKIRLAGYNDAIPIIEEFFGETQESFRAASAFFGITSDESMLLFDPEQYCESEYQDTSIVSARIRAAANGDWPDPKRDRSMDW